MENFKNICYLCGKPSVLYYDFVVIEMGHKYINSGNYSQTYTQVKIDGIVRIALCHDCLLERLDRHIKENTYKNGQPKLFKKKIVDECKQIHDKLNAKDYRKTTALELLFFTTLAPYEKIVSFNGKKPDLNNYCIYFGKYAIDKYGENGKKFIERVPYKVRERIQSKAIEPDFTLFTLSDYMVNNVAPFRKSITPSLLFSDSYYILHFVEHLDKLSDIYGFSNELKQTVIEFSNFYSSNFI